MDHKADWEAVYERNASDQVSWYRPHLERSIAFIEKAGVPKDAAIIDVGGGTSTLMDDLLDRGYSNLTVLDLSARAIANARDRLGTRASLVEWIVADITTVSLAEHRYQYWHDRAVFHFLRETDERHRYVDSVTHGLKPGGHMEFVYCYCRMRDSAGTREFERTWSTTGGASLTEECPSATR